MDNSADFVCVGDATQDNFYFIHDASVHCDLNEANCELILKYGQKIGVQEVGVSVGGNAANVAVGLARLGIKTNLLTTFADDERGAWIKTELLRSGVNLDHSVNDPKRQSNQSAIVIFKGERTILSFHDDGPDLIRDFPRANFYFVSSTAGRDSTSLHEQVLGLKKNNPEMKVAFNPAVADLKRGKEFLIPMLSVTWVLFINFEEAEMLLGDTVKEESRTEQAKKMLLEINKLGPETVVITDGKNGAYAMSGAVTWFVPACQTCGVVETTGAGDAFSGGFLGSLFNDEENIEQALRWAVYESSSVIETVGAQVGLLTKEEIQRDAKGHSYVRPVQI